MREKSIFPLNFKYRSDTNKTFNKSIIFQEEIWPSDFFDSAFGQKIYFSWPLPDCAPGCPNSYIKDGYCDLVCNTTQCMNVRHRYQVCYCQVNYSQMHFLYKLAKKNLITKSFSSNLIINQKFIFRDHKLIPPFMHLPYSMIFSYYCVICITYIH